VDYQIPGYGDFIIEHIVFDYNGTIASEGSLIGEVAESLKDLSGRFTLHVITADTFGTVEKELAGLDCSVHIIEKTDQAAQKEEFVKTLGADRVVSMGNGRNDILMLRASKLGIAVIGDEGAFTETILASDITVRSIADGLRLLRRSECLTATLRG